jgi:hypothetical protein
MSPAEKERLRQRLETFLAMKPGEQENLRRLHGQIESDSEAAKLRTVMNHYYKWYTTLPPFRRDELQELKPEDRIKRVKTLLAEQTQRDAKKALPEDIAGVIRWMDKYTEKHEDQLVRSLPETFRKRYAELSPGMRPQVLVWWHWQAMMAGRVPPLSQADFTDLRKYLSAETRKRLEEKPAGEQWHILLGWIRQVVRQKSNTGNLKSLFWLADEQQISQFFERGLNDQQRDWLLSLPPDEMQRELRRLYYQSRMKPSDRLERRPGKQMPFELDVPGMPRFKKPDHPSRPPRKPAENKPEAGSNAGLDRSTHGLGSVISGGSVV